MARTYQTDTLTGVEVKTGVHVAQLAAVASGTAVEVERVALFCTANPTVVPAFICDGAADVDRLPLWNAIDYQPNGEGVSVGYAPPLRVKAGQPFTIVWSGVPAGKICLARVQYVTVTPVGVGG